MKVRKAEAGVAAAVEQIRTKIDQRRVLVFGLRNVAEFTSPSNRHYIDNVYCAVEEGIVELLKELQSKYGAEEDLVVMILRIVSGITKAFAVDAEQDSTLIQKAIDEGLSGVMTDCMTAAVNLTKASDREMFAPALVISQVGLTTNVLQVTPEIIEAATKLLDAAKNKYSKEAVQTVTIVAQLFVRQNKGDSLVCDQQLPTKILKAVQVLSSTQQAIDSNSVQFMADVLGGVLEILQATKSYGDSGEASKVVLALLQNTKSKKGLTETLGKILAQLVGPDELQRHVEQLNKGDGDSLGALNMLSALSQSAAFASSFTNPEPLCSIINQFNAPNDPAQVSSLKAATCMLKTLCGNHPKQIPSVLSSVESKVDSLLATDLPVDVLEPLCGLATVIGVPSLSGKSITALSKVLTETDFNLDSHLAIAQLLAGMPVNSVAPTDVPATLAHLLTKKSSLFLAPCAKLGDRMLSAQQIEPTMQTLAPAVLKSLANLNQGTDRAELEATLPFLQHLSTLSQSYPEVEKTLTEMGFSAAVLRCSILFTEYPHIVKICESILRKSASTTDVSKAVEQLLKASKDCKNKYQECVEACATIHGVCTLSSAEGVGADALDGVIKALGNICQHSYFANHRILVNHCLACIKALGPLVSSKEPLGDEPHRLLTIAHSAGCRAIADQEQSGKGDSIVTEIVKGAVFLVQLDHFNDPAPLEKCTVDLTTLLRKYPDQRKTQVQCMQCLAALLQSSSGDVSHEFLKSGAAKQVIGTMSRGAAMEEYQAAGLKVIHAAAVKKPENADGLRRAGVVEVLRMISENYQSKPDILKLCQQCQSILTPQDQVRDEVLSQIEALQVAGKNRDIKTGSEALAALAGLSAAADAAKFAAKNGVGNALNVFFDSIKIAPALPYMETCSLGAVQTLRNVGNVGKPHSSAMIKSGAINLIQTILEDAMREKQTVTGANQRTASDVVAQCLEASRCLLTNETQPLKASGAKALGDYLASILPSLTANSDPKEVLGIISTVGLLGNQELLQSRAFNQCLPHFIKVLQDARTEDERVDALRSMYQMVHKDKAAAILVQKFTEAGGCEAVIQCLDTYGGEEQKTAIWCRKVLERIVATNGDIQHAIMKRGGSDAVNTAVRALGRNLAKSSDNEGTATVLNMMCKLTAKVDNRKLNTDSSVLDVVTAALEDASASNSLEIKSIVGELLGNLGGDAQVAAYFEHVIQLCNEKPKNWQVDLGLTLQKLHALTFCHPDDIDIAFGKSPEALAALTALLPSLVEKSEELVEDICLLVKNLAQRFREDPMSRYGVQSALGSGFVNCAVQLICDSKPSTCVRKNTFFLRDVYETLELCCSNEITYKSIAKLAMANEEKFLKASWDLLYKFKSQEDVATAIISFMGHFSRTPEAVEALETARANCEDKENVRYLGEDSSQAIYKVIWNLRRNPQCVGSGLDALGLITVNRQGRSKILQGAMRKEFLEQVKQMAENSPEAAAGFAGFARCLLTSDMPETEDIWVNVLEILVKQYLQLKDRDDVDQEVRDRLLRRMGGLIQEFAQRKKYQLIRTPQAIECLSEAVRCERPRNQQAVRTMLAATDAMRDDQVSWNTFVTVVIDSLLGYGLDTIIEEGEDQVKIFLDLCLYLCEADEDNLRALQENPDMIVAVTTIEAAAAANGLSRDPPNVHDIFVMCDQLKNLLMRKVDEKLKLETIYKRWTARLERSEHQTDIFDLGENASSDLLAEIDFVLREMEEYCQNQFGNLEAVAQHPVGREFWFGSHCFDLLHSYPLNSVLLCNGRAQIHTWITAALGNSAGKTEHVQALVQAIINVAPSTVSVYYGGEPRAPEIMVAVVRGALNREQSKEGINSWTIARVLNPPNVTDEDWLVERLLLMTKFCGDTREYYNQTQALDVLKQIWIMIDKEEFGVKALKGILKVLRVMANEGICDQFISLNFCEALLALVDDTTATSVERSSVLADALMVIGFMASFVKTKNYFGRLEGVRRIVDLLKRCEKEAAAAVKGTAPSSAATSAKLLALSKVQQNACLAIGNLVLGHPQNGTDFGKQGGVDLANRIMNSAMSSKVDYDLANAACVLMCNASFKRDDFKEAFGKAGTPGSILMCIKKYDGANISSAHRCLGSMFKAVGNLALIPANVQRFLEADVGQCFKTFYERVNAASDQETSADADGEGVSDQLLLVSLKTLSNLTMENAEAFMQHFGHILVPLITLVSDRSTRSHNGTGRTYASEAELMAFVCDTFASLCRNSENRASFINHKGIEKCIELVNQYRNELIYIKALDLFAVLASYSDASRIMADNNLFTFILGVLEEGEDLDSLTVVSALRVIRRLISPSMNNPKQGPNTNSALAIAKVFVDAAPIPLMCECLKAAAPYANESVPCGSTVKEISQIILTLLYLNEPLSSPTEIDMNQNPNLKDVPWVQELLSGSAIRSRQFTRVFTQRRKTDNDNSELTESSSEDNTENNENDPSLMDTDYSSSGHNDPSESKNMESEGATDSDDDPTSPVDLQTPPRRDESANMNRLNSTTTTPQLYKPKGTRAFETIGMDPKSMVTICRAIYLMVINNPDETIRVDKLANFALSLVAYAVTEKIDGCALIFANAGHQRRLTSSLSSNDKERHSLCLFIDKVFSKTKENKCLLKLRILAAGAEIVANGCAMVDGIEQIANDKQALDTLKASCSALTKSKESVLRKRIEAVWALLVQISQHGLGQSIFYALASYEFPIDPEDLTNEQFPNGVQDLPLKIKDKIRKGGLNKCIVRNGSDFIVKPLWWKSSTDLFELRFMNDASAQNYDYHIPLGRVRKIVRGTNDAELRAQLTKLKVKPRHIISVCGGDAPEVIMVFSNRIKASRMFDRMVTWHTAATR